MISSPICKCVSRSLVFVCVSVSVDGFIEPLQREWSDARSDVSIPVFILILSTAYPNAWTLLNNRSCSLISESFLKHELPSLHLFQLL